LVIASLVIGHLLRIFSFLFLPVLYALIISTMNTTPSNKIHFGHSPDPDDAFMFYAIANQKIDTAGFEIEHVVEDIESLNHRAIRGELEATAVSVHAYGHVSDQYAIMRSGASVGEGYGPVVVSANPLSIKDLETKTIAVPGMLTTAYLVLKLCLHDFRTVVVPFDQIMDHVFEEKADAGVIIHEGQLTYEDRHLYKVLDLGAWWFSETKLPLPLGIDVIRKDLGFDKMKALARVFRESIIYSLEHRKEALEYALPFGRGISRTDEDRFVAMYVNDFTRDIGERGEAAIRELLNRGVKTGVLAKKVAPEFVG